MKSKGVTGAIVELVFDVDGSDSAAAGVAHRPCPTMNLQPCWGISRQESIVELAADHGLKSLRVHDSAHGEKRAIAVPCSLGDPICVHIDAAQARTHFKKYLED